MSSSQPSALRLDHVLIPVSDPAASFEFYSGVLGLELLHARHGRNWGGRDWIMLTFGLPDSRQLALVALRGFVPRRQRGLPRDALHYAFAVSTKRALNEWKKRLEEAEVPFWEEDHGDQVSVYCEDPDGLILEIAAPPSWPRQTFERDPRTFIRRWLKTGAMA